MTSEPLPSPSDVGDYYDRLTLLANHALGGNTHLGYWPQPHDGSSAGEASDRLTDFLIEKLHASTGQRVLDIGCGSGRPAVRLARTESVDVVGVTISTVQVELATTLAEQEGVADRVRFVHADAQELPFPDDSFDAVWAIECLLHMPSTPQVLTEVARVLRPGGRFAASDLVAREEKTSTDPAATEWNHIEQFAVPPLTHITEYPRMIAESGLQLREFIDIGDDVISPSYAALRNHAQENFTDYMAAFGLDEDQLRSAVTHYSQQSAAQGVGYVVVTAIRN
ncbi:SAM-dependent methyltransferase [Streptomyces stramineus]|uniref:27-O-demethylrifamycin SV methyltransferase n=1 Tax=Streptomyces stramineus TaxID=173861 RepID=A0ABP3KTK2_9ACTN